MCVNMALRGATGTVVILSHQGPQRFALIDRPGFTQHPGRDADAPQPREVCLAKISFWYKLRLAATRA